MTKLEKLVHLGILKNNEEIYINYKEEVYVGRIINNGAKIKTSLGEYRSISSAASQLLLSNPRCLRNIKNSKGETPNNGGYWWRTWNNIQLTHLFKQYLK